MENLTDPLVLQPKGKDATPRNRKVIGQIFDLIDRASSKPNLIDRTSSSEEKSTENDLIDQAEQIRKSKKINKVIFKPDQELDVFFDKFENQLFEEHKEKSSANLKAVSNSERAQKEEWRYRAEVAEERVARLQDLKELRDSQHRTNVDKLENKVKMLVKKKTGGCARSDKRVRQDKNEARGENLNVSSSVENRSKDNSNESSDDEWIVLRIPKNNRTKFSADFMDCGVGDGKEWLDGPCNLDVTIGELIQMRDEGRASRKAREEGALEGASENQGIRRRRRSKPKPAPDLLTLRRSIAPGSYKSWSEHKPWDNEDEVDRQIKEHNTKRDDSLNEEDVKVVAQSESDVERYIQEQREAFRRPSSEEKQQDRRVKDDASSSMGVKKMNENFRSKLSARSPKIGRDDLINAERLRQKRVRESSCSSGEEEERLKELKWSDVVTSDVVEKQQAVIDFCAEKRREGRSRLEEAQQRLNDLYT